MILIVSLLYDEQSRVPTMYETNDRSDIFDNSLNSLKRGAATAEAVASLRVRRTPSVDESFRAGKH